MTTIHILIADDQPRVRESLRALLETEDDLAVVGEARDGQEALDQAALLAPHVVVMDLEMPRLDGLAATQALAAQAQHPAVVMLSIHSSAWAEARARQAGAAAFVSKFDRPEKILRAIREVAYSN